MRLTELDPHWYVLETGAPVLGLSFECPCCRKQRLGIAFHHAGREAMEDQFIMAHSPSTKHIWNMTGDSFENITLSPSVDASELGHWHGFITNGEVT